MSDSIYFVCIVKLIPYLVYPSRMFYHLVHDANNLRVENYIHMIPFLLLLESVQFMSNIKKLDMDFFIFFLIPGATDIHYAPSLSIRE